MASKALPKSLRDTPRNYELELSVEQADDPEADWPIVTINIEGSEIVAALTKTQVQKIATWFTRLAKAL